MRKTVLAAAAAAAFLTGGMSMVRAEAVTTPAASPAVGAATTDTAAIRLAAIVCGNGGCLPVQTKAKQRRKFKVLGHG